MSNNHKLVYNYTLKYDKIHKYYKSLDFKMYNYDEEIYLLDIHPFMHDGRLQYYTFNYKNNDLFDKSLTNCHLYLSSKPFMVPIYFYEDLNLIPKVIITDHLSLQGGFSIDEETKYGFIYLGYIDTGNIKKADKYGLKNTGEIDYNKYISGYSITSNGLLIVRNRFLEEYNYIATKKEYSTIMTQDDFNKSNNLLQCIFITDRPKKIMISKKGQKDLIHDIDIKYNNIGLPKSVIIDGKEQCTYNNDNGQVKSIHPLLYEPFCQELYKDILLEDLPYTVEETYETVDNFIIYTRKLYR